MKKIFAVIALLSFVSLANAEVKTEEIEYSHNGVKLTGYLAFNDSKVGKRPGILVVHEWLRLPILNHMHAQYALDSLANLRLGHVTNDNVHGSPLSNLNPQSIRVFLISLYSMSRYKSGCQTSEDLCSTYPSPCNNI